MALATKIKAEGSDVAGIAYNVHDWPDDWLWRAMILQGGGRMLDESESTVAVRRPGRAQGAARPSARFVTDGGMPLIDWDQSRQQFIAGKIGIFFDTPARMRQVTDLIGDKFMLAPAIFPIDDKAKGGAADRRQRRDHHRRATRRSRRRPGSSSSSSPAPKRRRSSSRRPATCRRTCARLDRSSLGPFYEANPNFRTVTRQAERSAPWQGYPGGNSVRIWRTQREIINAVMRGTTPPQEGFDKLAAETSALMK